jgi:hypothetical protein
MMQAFQIDIISSQNVTSGWVSYLLAPKSMKLQNSPHFTVKFCSVWIASTRYMFSNGRWYRNPALWFHEGVCILSPNIEFLMAVWKNERSTLNIFRRLVVLVAVIVKYSKKQEEIIVLTMHPAPENHQDWHGHAFNIVIPGFLNKHCGDDCPAYCGNCTVVVLEVDGRDVFKIWFAIKMGQENNGTIPYHSTQ